MININKKRAMTAILNHDGVIAEEVYDTELGFKSKYHDAVGKLFHLGSVDGIVKEVKWFSKAEKPYGLLIYQLPYELELVRRKVDKKC